MKYFHFYLYQGGMLGHATYSIKKDVPLNVDKEDLACVYNYYVGYMPMHQIDYHLGMFRHIFPTTKVIKSPDSL